MLENFIIVDMPKTDDDQIILGRPILATAGCHIDVRKGRNFSGGRMLCCVLSYEGESDFS